ncbi:MAG: hypothetical protein ACRD99_05630 [Nitrososphaera sp.]
MRTAVLTLLALALLLPVTDNAFAAQFAFDPHSGTGSNPPGGVIPVAIVAIASLLGGILIILERRRQKEFGSQTARD